MGDQHQGSPRAPQSGTSRATPAVRGHDQQMEAANAFEELANGEQSLTAVLQPAAQLAKAVVPDAGKSRSLS
jgi:hypothetical protein